MDELALVLSQRELLKPLTEGPPPVTLSRGLTGCVDGQGTLAQWTRVRREDSATDEERTVRRDARRSRQTKQSKRSQSLHGAA